MKNQEQNHQNKTKTTTKNKTKINLFQTNRVFSFTFSTKNIPFIALSPKNQKNIL